MSINNIVIRFQPGLVPVLKHGSHDQSSHGRKGGSLRGYEEATPSGKGQRIRDGVRESDDVLRFERENVDYLLGRTNKAPSWTGPSDPLFVPKTTLKDRVKSARRNIKAWKQKREKRSLERMSPAQIDRLIAANRERNNRERVRRGLAPTVYKSFDPVYEILQRVFADEVEPSIWVALIEDPRPLAELTGVLGDLVDDMLAAVVPDETIVKFAPGLRPVLKHGSHNQKDHAGRTGGGEIDSGSPKLTVIGKHNGPNKNFNEKTRVVRHIDDAGNSTDYLLYAREELGTKSVRASRLSSKNEILETVGSLDAVGPGANAWNRDRETDKGTITHVNVTRSNRRRGLASAMLRFHRDMFPEWDVEHSDVLSEDGKSWADVVKHLGGAHDQKTHARGGGRQMKLDGVSPATGKSGEYSEWGDRASELKRSANIGPEEYVLRNAFNPDLDAVDDQDVRDRIYDVHDWKIEAEVEDRMSRTLMMEDEEEVEATRESYREEILDEYVATYGDQAREALAVEQQFDSEGMREQFNDVYGISHEGVTRNGEVVTLEPYVTEVYPPSGGERNIDVRGEIYNDNGDNVGRFHRKFEMDDDGNLTVSHELLEIDDDYQGTGFAKVFNRQAENYYITHGMDTVKVHAALDGGGYAWASSGFDWDYGKHNASTANVTGRMEDYLIVNRDRIPSNLRADILSTSDRLVNLSVTNPDYPTPKEIADLGRIDGVSNWPGKEIMRGSNWYGTKTLRPEGARVSTTQASNDSKRASQRAYNEERARVRAEGAPSRGQLTMDTAFLDASLAQAPNYQPGLFTPIPGMVE